MFIQNLEIHSALLNETTSKLMEAIENTDVVLIKELSAEIEKLSAKVAKYSEKAQKEITRTIGKIETGQLKKVEKKDINENEKCVVRMEAIIEEAKELAIESANNGNDNSKLIEALNNEYFTLTLSSNGITGTNVSLECEYKTNNKWGFVGREPILNLKLNELTLKKTTKGLYLYKNENERYIINN